MGLCCAAAVLSCALMSTPLIMGLEAGRLSDPVPHHAPSTVQAAGMHHGAKGAAALLAGWKNNPNERKHIATNRRRK